VCQPTIRTDKAKLFAAEPTTDKLEELIAPFAGVPFSVTVATGCSLLQQQKRARSHISDMASPLARITKAAAETVTGAATEALVPNFKIGGKKVYL
jgi:hypothetical protein